MFSDKGLKVSRQHLLQLVIAATLIMLILVGCGTASTPASEASSPPDTAVPPAEETQPEDTPETVSDTPPSQPLSECGRITDPGRYHLTMDLDGAPIQVQLAPVSSDNHGLLFERTCLEIASSEVILDCRGKAQPKGKVT